VRRKFTDVPLIKLSSSISDLFQLEARYLVGRRPVQQTVDLLLPRPMLFNQLYVACDSVLDPASASFPRDDDFWTA